MSRIVTTIALTAIIFVNCSDGMAIYDSLIGCYRGNETQPLFPYSLPLLIELVRKVEDASGNAMNIRTLSTMLLHTIRIDGIEREPNARESDLVTPYGADGVMSPKFLILLKMVSNVTTNFDIRSALTESEICQLHRMISATVDPWERGDESNLCPLQYRNGNSAARRHHSIRPFDGTQFSYVNNQRRLSRCPTEGGTVRSFDYCTFTAGTIIASIAAGLQPQNVPVNQLISFDYKRTRWDALESMKTRDTAKELRKLLRSLDVIESGYAAGLAGDLAEICVYQGPYLNPNLSIGVNGHWNDTYLPRIRYLDHVHHFPRWEMTDSEILAGIDGSFLAQKIAVWTNNSMRLRLSQVLDMYYSSRGLPFLPIENINTDRTTPRDVTNRNFNSVFISTFNTETNRKFVAAFDRPELHDTVKANGFDHFSTQDGITSACSRRQILRSIDRNKLKDETYLLSQVLQLSTSSVAIADRVLRLNCNAAVDKFFNYSVNLLQKQSSCSELERTASPQPVVDLTLITDGSRDHFSTLQLISFLAESIGTSKYSSHISVIDGTGGNRIVNRTQSIADAFQQLRNFSVNDSQSNLQLSRSLATYLEMMSIQMLDERSNGTIAALPHVLLITSQGQRIAENDFSNARRMLRRATTQFPDLYIIFIANNERLAEDLFYGTNSYGEQQNTQYFFIKEESVQIVRFQKQLLDMLRPLPRRIMAPFCTGDRLHHNVDQKLKNYNEEYVSTNEDLIYRVSPYYLVNTYDIQIKFDGVDYGTFSVCMARNRNFTDADCQTVSGYETISFYLLDPCDSDNDCQAIFFRISVDRSLIKCFENSCRYPDQVRFNIRQMGLRCDNNSSNRTAYTTLLISVIVVLVQIFFY